MRNPDASAQLEKDATHLLTALEPDVWQKNQLAEEDTLLRQGVWKLWLWLG